MTRRRKIIYSLALIMMLFPLKTTCGQVNYSCLSAPDPNGVAQRYYEVEPLGLAFIETLVGANWRLYYWSGYDEVKVR